MVDSGQFPHFKWPSHKKSLEDDPELSAGDMMSDSISTKGQLSTNIFTATRDVLARATKEITTENILKENAIGDDIDTHSRSSGENIVESSLSTQTPFLQPSKSEELTSVTKSINEITKMISNVVSLEKNPLDTGNSTSTEAPIKVYSESPLITTSEFRINMNTNSSNTIDTMKNVFTETMSKERGLFESGTNEETMSMTSNTIETLRHMFMKAIAREKPLLDDVKTESSLTEFSTPTEKPLLETLSVKNILKEENITVSENASAFEKIKGLVSSTTESNNITDFSQSDMEKIEDMLSTTQMAHDSIKTSGSIDMSSDVFSEPTTAINDFEKLTDILSSTDRSSMKLDNIKSNSTIEILTDMFQESYSTEPTGVEEMKDMLSTTLTERPSAELSQNKLEKIKNIFTATSQTDEPFLRDIVSTTLTENASMELSETSSEKIKGIFSSTSETDEPAVSFGWSTGTNDSTDLMTDIFNESTETTYYHPPNIFHTLKNMLSTTKDPSIELNLKTRTNSTAELMADRMKNVLSVDLPTKNPPFDVGKNSTVDIPADVFNISTSTEETILNTNMGNLKDILLTDNLTNASTKQSSIEFDLSTQANSSDSTIADLLYRSTPMKQQIFEEMKDISSTTIATGKDSINSITSTNSNIIADIFNNFTTVNQSTSLNSTINMSVPELTSVSTNDININLNSTISTNKTIFEKSTQMYTPSSTVDFFNMFSGNASTEKPLQLKLNSTLDIFTTEMSTEASLISTSNSTRTTFINFNNAVTSNSTSIFSTESTINTNFSTDVLESSKFTEKMDSGSPYHMSTIKTTIEDIFSTITSNNSSLTEETFYATDKETQTGGESDLTLYIIVGVILIVSIIFIIGGYILCRKCRKNSKSPGCYYSTRLKDYSDSSVKTVSETDTLNIRL
ncbi:uncharacterized protein isoform X2 [Leptinotarsa decemlineata]|uniref:uncharacterized protein isoform X2 n=1 Tax=Leptinotarsa decemlineata TaxID=7539 RepID=UPI003D3091E7